MVAADWPTAHEFPDLCALGKCAHAASESNPCRCPDCDPETRALALRYRSEAAHAQAQAVKRASRTKPKFESKTFAEFKAPLSGGAHAALAAAKRVAADPRQGVGLYGESGLGKSHLAGAIVNASIAQGVAARFVDVVEMLSELRATYNPGGSGSENSVLNGYAAVPVLVLDDLGQEALTGWTVRTMRDLVNRRYERGLPLIVTSNFSPAELAARKVAADAEPRTYLATLDRLKEMVGEWVEVRGKSQRGKRPE